MAATTIVFYGIRLNVAEDEIESLEERSHTAVVVARKAGLDHYWGNFDAPGERYYLFLGKLFGKLGEEDSKEALVTSADFSNTAADVDDRLSKAGFSQTPSLYLQFQPDA